MRHLSNALEKFFSGFVDTFGRTAAGNPLTPPRQPMSPVLAFKEGFAQVETSEGWQPPDPPYITYQTKQPDLFGNVMIRVDIWDRWATPAVFGTVDDIIKQISDEIPPMGAKVIPLASGGSVRLFRNNPYTSHMAGDDKDPTWVRGVVNLIIRGYS